MARVQPTFSRKHSCMKRSIQWETTNSSYRDFWGKLLTANRPQRHKRRIPIKAITYHWLLETLMTWTDLRLNNILSFLYTRTFPNTLSSRNDHHKHRMITTHEFVQIMRLLTSIEKKNTLITSRAVKLKSTRSTQSTWGLKSTWKAQVD